jgi:hypothetical protein
MAFEKILTSMLAKLPPVRSLDSIDVMTFRRHIPGRGNLHPAVSHAACRSYSRMHGSFPELVAQTGGGVLVPQRYQTLADALADLLGDPARRMQLGRPAAAWSQL